MDCDQSGIKPIDKCRCVECGWYGSVVDVLVAKSPFDHTEVEGCPTCKAVNKIHYACWSPGCWNSVSVGMHTPRGYSHFCYQHDPKEVGT